MKRDRNGLGGKIRATQGGTPGRERAGKGPSVGDEIVRGLKGLRDALSAGESLPRRFTMRTVELELEPREWSSREIRELRDQLKASQSVFAKLIGSSAKTVQAWEQGKVPPPMACRLLECIERDRARWEQVLRKNVRVETVGGE